MALVDTYQEALARVRLVASRGVALSWDRLGTYNLADVPVFVDSVVPLVTGAQRQAASLTIAYLARRGAALPGVDLASITGGAPRGVDLAEVYRRPFVTTWTALKDGHSWRDAVDQGRTRAMSTAEADVAMSTRDAAAAVVQGDDRIVGWERVPDGGACELCLLASTQRYHSEDLMPIHNRCGCTVEPIFGDEPAPHVIAPEQLRALKADDLTEARRIAADRVAVREHGELGPVLTEKADSFTGPSDLA